LNEVIQELSPDIILVHGDTSTTFAGSLTAFYNKVPVGHVEEGLRTFDKYAPFPEEMNRKLTGNVVEMYFDPTKPNKSNLLNEGINKGIYLAGTPLLMQ